MHKITVKLFSFFFIFFDGGEEICMNVQYHVICAPTVGGWQNLLFKNLKPGAWIPFEL